MMQQELRQILDHTGTELLSLAERHVAVDGRELSQDPLQDAEIYPFYTLQDQLFVEPQPLALPTRVELNIPIRMSRAEYAVARSHINIWKKVVTGNEEYVLILEDDVWFHSGFARYLDKVWNQVFSESNINSKFDILYLSYLEVKHGAPKTILSSNVFMPVRGLWHLSGYVLSKKGAEKLLHLLPCYGPIDLWINHQFKALNVLASKESIINQRRDTKSTNSYSILPSLTKIGAINSERSSLFNIRPMEQPVFAFGSEGTGCTSLAMALSMLGYTCCSDLNDLPITEMNNLLNGKEDRIFNAYVNIGALDSKIKELLIQYPKAKFILMKGKDSLSDKNFASITDKLRNVDLTVLHSEELNKWRVICEHLRCAPPACAYPLLKDLGQRLIINDVGNSEQNITVSKSKRDNSPWVIEHSTGWQGIRPTTEEGYINIETFVEITDRLQFHDPELWHLRQDTFTDNLALFRPSNINFSPGIGAVLTVKREFVGVRDYTAASLCSKENYLFGRFEATIKASNVPGVVTGLFLHRNSPRQEIDIEIAGNRPSRLLVNVFYNPGDEGASFDYGYRGTPTYIDLGFDASKESHSFAIEWTPNEIRWLVDDNLVHKRAIWEPTPIPHLPMTFHINSWVSRSTQLAGRIRNRGLPTATVISKITVSANKVASISQENVMQSQLSLNNFSPSQFIL
jgi:GR25 family glycosyltransferase involved in LPS biosynthesis